MDKIGVALGVCASAQVLTSSSEKKAYIKSSRPTPLTYFSR